MVGPAIVVVALVVAVAKPWGGADRDRTTPTPPVEAAASGGALAASSPEASAARPGDTGPASAAEVIASVEIDAVPWANELAADDESAWVWSDDGVIHRVRADDDGVTLVSRIEIGPPADGARPSIGTRGIAIAWSQVWAADPGHRGLARIERGAERVVDRIELPTTDPPDPGAATTDRRPDASGFAIDGDSIFVPTLEGPSNEASGSASSRGALWRVDTSTGDQPGWIALDQPTGVAVGFGSIWVVTCCDDNESRTYTIVRLERETGGVQASITLPAGEAGADDRPVIRVGPDSVWVGLVDPALIVRIDPATSSVRSTIPVDLPVTDMAIGPAGGLWLTQSEPWYRIGAVVSDRCDGVLARLDPATDEVATATTIACPMSVAIAGDDIWVGSAGTEGRGTSGGQPPMLVHLRAAGTTR
jgi:hypothetical protein